MVKKRIYISGKVYGLSVAEVSMKFGLHEKNLLLQGHEPIVPLNFRESNDSWQSVMKKCIAALCTCDEIHMLPDWGNSPEAYWEHEIAMRLKLPILYLK